MESTQIYSTGRRKTAVARVWLKPGAGSITVNSKEVSVYFPRKTLLAIIQQAFEAANALNKFDVVATVEGRCARSGALKTTSLKSRSEENTSPARTPACWRDVAQLTRSDG